MGLKQCHECKKEVSTEAKTCPACGAPVKKQASLAVKIIGGLILFFIFIGFIGSLFNHENKSAPTSPPAMQEKKYSASERLNLARQCLTAGYKPDKDITKISWGNVAGAKGHLAAIKPNDKEYAEAQILLKEVSRRELEIQKTTAVLLKQSQIEKRKNIGKEIEHIFVKTGIDVYVAISGKEKEIITMTYVLWSRPLAYKYMNNESFYSLLKNAGFKKAIFDDKYNNTWTYTIK